MKGDFPALTLKRAIATPEQIRAIFADREGNEAIFSFDFETKVPYKIKGITIDIGNVER